MNIRVKAIVLIFSGLCSLGSLNGQNPDGSYPFRAVNLASSFPIDTVHGNSKNPAPTDEESWKDLSGTRCAWGDTYTRYKKEVNPHLNQKKIDIKRMERRKSRRTVGSFLPLSIWIMFP